MGYCTRMFFAHFCTFLGTFESFLCKIETLQSSNTKPVQLLKYKTFEFHCFCRETFERATFREEAKGRFWRMFGTGKSECTLVPGFWYKGTSECTLVPVFCSRGTSPKPPFGNHPFANLRILHRRMQFSCLLCPS